MVDPSRQEWPEDEEQKRRRTLAFLKAAFVVMTVIFASLLALFIALPY